MATLNINGRRVKVDDSFRNLSPEQQQATVDEIARSAGLVAGAPGSDAVKLTGRAGPRPAELGMSPNIQDRRPGEGLAMNALGGLNRSLLEMSGGVVDRARNTINWGVAGVNALRGADDLTQGMIRNAVGDSDSITGALGAVGFRDPRTIKPKSGPERIAAGLGEGVGYTLGPQAAVSTLGRLGAMAPKTREALSPLVGGLGVRETVQNAVAGAGAGAGAAAGMEVAPDSLDPLAGLAGGLGGALAGTAVAAIPGAVRSAGRVAGDFLAPLTSNGRQRLAGQTLYDAASNPEAAMGSLANPRQIVPGSLPTTFQATGDMGLGALERGAATRAPDAFNQRRADQNAARLGQMSGLSGFGAPEAVVSTLRARLADLDRVAEAQVTAATRSAQGRAASLGPGQVPEAVGTEMRAGLESARAAAKAQEQALWKAVDPDGTLALPAANAKSQMEGLLRDLPESAKRPEGEEAAIYDVLSTYRNVMPFSEVTALQSRIKSEMRAERMAKGETPAWRRLSMLNGALERDINAAVAGRASEDAVAVAAGRMAPEQSMATRIEAASAPQSGTAVYTPSGRKVDVAYRVIDADQAVTSNTDDMRPNPAYAPDLQPRNRTRTASEVQIARMAGELQPERLGPSASAAEGAPIIGPDGMVESGNARMLAIRKAYKQGGKSAAAYRQYLQQQGYDLAGIRNPVLVRVRQTSLDGADRVRFTQEANASPTLALSASERAASDASRLDGSILALYRGGDVASADNRDFVRAFLGKVADQGEEGAFVTRDGALSLDGARRVQGALLRAAYDDNALIEALAEAGDENVRVFGRALSDLSGAVAKLKAGIRAGQVDPGADISPALVEAAKFVQDARRRGVSLPNALAQQDAFNAVSDDAINILNYGYGSNLDGRFSRERFDEILRIAISEAGQQTADARLFGEPMAASEILQGVTTRYGGSTGAAQGVAVVAPDFGARSGAGGAPGGRPAASPSGPSPSARGTGGSGSGEILQRPELAPNFDAAAQGRLRAAQEATRGRLGTFDNKMFGPIRRRPSTTAPYDMPAGVLPGRIFAPGPGSAEVIRAFRNAVGDGPAFRVLEDYAIDRLRRTALRDDGTLDPAKVDAWRRTHSDALRSFPQLDARFADAAQASRAMGEAIAARKAALAEANTGAAARLIGLEDPADVVRVVGSVFGRQDAATRMFQLRGMLGKDMNAVAGLKRAVADYMTGRFVANTEAGTSGLGTIRGDQFVTFLRQSRPALRAAGFSEDELSTMQRVADDLMQANRSLTAVRIPGQSNTAQDALSARIGDNPTTILTKIMLASIGTGSGATALGGPVVGAAVGLGSALLGVLRQSGIAAIDGLVRDALLDPALARALMVKATPRTEKSAARVLGKVLTRGYLGGSQSMDRKQDQPQRTWPSSPALPSAPTRSALPTISPPIVPGRI